ncbi:MAG: PQQ-binding-like beta-propeller repeat protein [Candidatus Alcyoniella australis]|nr:PQQ-binding-like beta-propeller repeat protein [Candidatus Alcyoniella australis]
MIAPKTLRALIALLATLLLCSCAPTDREGPAAQAALPPTAPGPHWNVLHADQARTVCMPVRGVRTAPRVLFDARDTELAVFSGTMVGPEGLLYRAMGPGPISLNPPEGIPLKIGWTPAVETRDPQSGELIRLRGFNLGMFTNFPSIDERGNVYVPDWARLSKYSPGMERLLWQRTFDDSPSDLLAHVPAGNMCFLANGDLLLPLLDGELHVLDPRDGRVLQTLDLRQLDPPVAPDPQHGKLGIVLRNALALDGDELFVLVDRELIRLRYDPTLRELLLLERTPYPGFSSSTPTLDLQNKRLLLVTYDPDQPDVAPRLLCYDYSQVPLSLSWSIETDLGFLESEDQLTNTYLPSSGVILNNALYGHVTAYIERDTPQGPRPQRLWSTRETVSESFGAYIASASDLDNTVYVVNNFEPRLYALDALSGKVLWSYALPARSIKTPIVERGVLYLDHHIGLLALTDQPAK